MKTKLFFAAFFAALVLTSMQVEAQEWAPIGAKWHYEIVDDATPKIAYVRYESVKDTVINSITCKKIIRTDDYANMVDYFIIGYQEFAYTYEQDRKVYVYNNETESFVLIYDFNMAIGDTYTVTWDDCDLNRTIENTELTDINGNEIKTLQMYAYKTFEWIGGQRNGIFHGLGWVFCGKAPQNTYVQRLRCYEDDFFGLYETGIASECEYTVSVNDMESQAASFSVFPNPSTGQINISFAKFDANTTVEIHALDGKTIYQKTVSYSTEDKTITILPELTNGVYFITLRNSTSTSTQRIIVSK